MSGNNNLCLTDFLHTVKWTRNWILDNPLIRKQPIDWIQKRIKEGGKGDDGVFTIGQFQDYLNSKLLPSWQIPKGTLPRRAQHTEAVETSKFLQVS